jgi:azurin
MNNILTFLSVSALVFSDVHIYSTEKEITQIVIKSDDLMKYDKTLLKLKKGMIYSIKLENIGKLPKAAMGHNLIILKSGIDAIKFGQKLITDYGAEASNDWKPVKAEKFILSQTKMLGPGESDTLKLKFEKKGSYHFLCSFPGHFGQMRGIITVD